MSFNTLYILNETYTNGYNIAILDVVSLISIFCAISVIVSKNPVVSILYLIGLFLCIASYLIIIGISFIGLSYLLVYVGAVSILFLFIIMLINIRISELLSETANSLPLVVIIALSLNYVLQDLFYSTTSVFKDTTLVPYVTTNGWDNNLIENSHITSIGNIMYTNYSIWLILTSVILLLAMVGAIIITIKPGTAKYGLPSITRQ